MSNRDHGKGVDFIVDRSDLRRCRFAAAPAAEEIDLAPGQVLLCVDRFAFTANNVTYAVAGEMMSYWSFFPTEPGWGRVPVWGFADVLRSRHDGLAPGQRFYGYLPMSTHLVVEPDRVHAGGFVDGVAHRRGLPPIYNQYLSTAGDAGYEACYENQQMLFRPLFTTAFLLDDFIADNDGFDARAVVLSSASSKTAFALAFLLHQRPAPRREVIGLTSPSNAAFVEGLGCYDRVVTYDRIAALSADTPIVFVDMAGNGAVVSALHHHFRDNVRHSGIVGLTHWEKSSQAADLPGAPPTFFFAPTQMQKRTKELGPDGLERGLSSAWRKFLGFVATKVRVIEGRGEADVERVYREMLDNRARPDEGHILSLRGAP